MTNVKYEIPKEKIDTGDILDLVFKDSSIKHGLSEEQLLQDYLNDILE